MTNFYDNLPEDTAQQIEALSRLSFYLRENRKSLLDQYQLEDESVLLDKIRCGDLPEHPAYEHYLSASILLAEREAVRQQLKAVLNGRDESDAAFAS